MIHARSMRQKHIKPGFYFHSSESVFSIEITPFGATNYSLTHTNTHLRPWEVARISSQHIGSIVIANCKGGSLVWLIVCLDPWLILSSILVRKPPRHTLWVSLVEYNVWTFQLPSILLCTLGWDFKCTWQQSLPVGPVETGTTFFSLPPQALPTILFLYFMLLAMLLSAQIATSVTAIFPSSSTIVSD